MSRLFRSRPPWNTANTPCDVGALIVRWLDGELPQSPTYLGRPDPETLEDPALLAALKAANTAGFVTVQSQPGFNGTGWDGHHWRQRAFVSLFCPKACMPVLAAEMTQAGLQVMFNGRIDLIESQGRTQPAPVVPRSADLDLLSGKAVASIATTTIPMGIVDLDWGRNTILWPALSAFFTPRT